MASFEWAPNHAVKEGPAAIYEGREKAPPPSFPHLWSIGPLSSCPTCPPQKEPARTPFSKGQNFRPSFSGRTLLSLLPARSRTSTQRNAEGSVFLNELFPRSIFRGTTVEKREGEKAVFQRKPRRQSPRPLVTDFSPLKPSRIERGSERGKKKEYSERRASASFSKTAFFPLRSEWTLSFSGLCHTENVRDEEGLTRQRILAIKKRRRRGASGYSKSQFVPLSTTHLADRALSHLFGGKKKEARERGGLVSL